MYIYFPVAWKLNKLDLSSDTEAVGRGTRAPGIGGSRDTGATQSSGSQYRRKSFVVEGIATAVRNGISGSQ